MYEQPLILVIEKDTSSCTALIEHLKKEAIEAQGTCNCTEAIERAKKTLFDLVIAVIDTQSRDYKKICEAVKEIKDANPEARILAVVDKEAIAKEAGADDYIRTPLDPHYLTHSIKRNLSLRSLLKENKKYAGEIEELKEQIGKYYYDLVKELIAKTKELALLFEIGKEIASSLSLHSVLDTIVKRTAQVLGVEICSILLLDELTQELYVAAAKGLPDEVIEKARFKRGERISGWVLNNKEALLINDISKEESFKRAHESRYYTNSFISVPLVFEHRAIGVLNVNNKRTRSTFTKEELKLVEGIADHASIALENARLYTNLQGVYIQIITALTSIIEVKDHYTKGHSERVTSYAVEIAREMNLNRSRVDIIRLACQLHDLGKIGVHEHILTKPGKLTDEEWQEIKLHPLKGVEILKPLVFLDGVINLVEQHHERFDGKGYPYGVPGKDIDLGARIICVADAFDAMTTDRPYAKALTVDEAIVELTRCAGAQFDPQVVDAFIKLLKENPKKFTK